MKLQYTPRAIRDLDGIRKYIEKDNPSAAWVVASFIRRSIRSLEDMPYQGRATETEDVRRLTVMNYPYVVYYRVKDTSVAVLSVRHTARNR